MKIGIIGAMEIEVAEIKELMESITSEQISGTIYYTGKIYGKDVVVAKCGVGKVNAAVCTQAMIMKYAPDVIINIGVAGSLSSKLDIGDLVISDHVVHHDFDISALNEPLGYIQEIDKIHIPSSKLVAEKIYSSANELENVNVYVGTIASGDQFVCNQDRKNAIVNNFNAMCTEMEGAAIGHVCYLNNVDFCIIRAISDKADGSAHMDFPTFARIAAKNSTELIRNYIKNI